MIGRPQTFRSQNGPRRLRARVADTTDPVWNVLGRRAVRGLWLGGWLFLTPAPQGSRQPAAWMALRVTDDAGGSRLTGVYVANPIGRGLLSAWVLMLGVGLAMAAVRGARTGGIDPVNLTAGGLAVGVMALMFWLMRPSADVDDMGRPVLTDYLAQMLSARPVERV